MSSQLFMLGVGLIIGLAVMFLIMRKHPKVIQELNSEWQKEFSRIRGEIDEENGRVEKTKEKLLEEIKDAPDELKKKIVKIVRDM